MSSMNKNDFLATIIPAAIHEMRETQILASLTIAQAILESGWGKSSLSAKYNNLFGVKATAADKAAGRAINLPTIEYRPHPTIKENGKPIMVKYSEDHYFRTYQDWGESLVDHSRLLQMPRYKAVIGEKDYKQACHAVKAAGYATDPNYPQLLIKVIEENKLQEIDKEVLRVEEPAKTPYWKTAIMDSAQANGLIDSSHKADDPAPKWFVCAVALSTLKKAGEKK